MKTSLYQVVVIANDFQIPFHDERALSLFKLFLRRERPDWLILNGDFQDFWEISSYDLTPRRGQEFKRQIETGQKILRSLRHSLPRARITWIEGNHEFRMRKYLIQNARELYGLPGVSVPDIFDLKRLKIEYAACHELATIINSPITSFASATSTWATGTGCQSTERMPPKFWSRKKA